MTVGYTPTIGLEVHAELLTRTKMFCGCEVVDTTRAEPNSSICPVCSGMPGSLPAINREAVRHALRVALSLNCTVAPFSLFARKNYFYPDLPKGYQISQYEYPLATGGHLDINTPVGVETIHVRRVHLEEDTGKLTHVTNKKERYSLVDLNRAGVALLEIVTEPDMFSLEAVRAYSVGLRAILKSLGACSGDMEKGAIRFEANISMREDDSSELGTRVEIKNLNSFRAMERALKYEIERQTGILANGGSIEQETVGWDEIGGKTISQRSKEEAHDYRYFPEPDLPPLIIDSTWLDKITSELPELPNAKIKRFIFDYQVSEYLANLLCEDPEVAGFFEKCIIYDPTNSPREIANWIIGDIFAFLNQTESSISKLQITPDGLCTIIDLVASGGLTRNNGKQVLNEVLITGKSPALVIKERGFDKISDENELQALVTGLINSSPREVEGYSAGKSNLLEWFVGQVMQKTHGNVDPNHVRAMIKMYLDHLTKE